MASVNIACTRQIGDDDPVTTMRGINVPEGKVGVDFGGPRPELAEGESYAVTSEGQVVVVDGTDAILREVPGTVIDGALNADGLTPLFNPPNKCEVISGWDAFAGQWTTFGSQLWEETINVVLATIRAIPYFVVYVLIILMFMMLWRAVKGYLRPVKDYTSLKTVTFGDESAVRSEFAASIISVLLIFFIWCTFTASSLIPSWLHLPGPFEGEASFTYVVEDEDGNRDEAEVFVTVIPFGDEAPELEFEPGDGIALNDGIVIATYNSELVIWDSNDEVKRLENGARLVEVGGVAVPYYLIPYDEENRRLPAVDENGDAFGALPEFNLPFGRVAITEKGTLNVVPNEGWRMQSLYLPPPESVWNRFVEILGVGYQNIYLVVHLGFSLFRVIVGFLLGAAVGIPLGYSMGLANWFRGWFDPIVEFMRPVPPLALIPLVIIWFGIGEVSKVFLLFLAALWIMAIAARAGVSGVRITKIHAAYSLGASRWQILRHVIIPNSLPEIFTGARVAMGVCWGTVVAAELVAAEEGIGKMITTASKFQDTDIILMGVILIGIIGFGIDVLMRKIERRLVPWKGRA